MKTVRVNASKSYDVIIGNGVLPSLGERCLSLFRGRNALVSTDDAVKRFWLDKLTKSLRAAGIKTHVFVFKAGERSKNGATLFKLLEFAARSGLTRDDFAVALGGGVTGDLTGLAASLYLRGIPCVQVPTSVLAAVDSSVGGKTAINLNAGKNLIGTFCQPSLVLCDVRAFETLPKAVFADGTAEIIKYGVICDGNLFYKVKDADLSDMENVVARCVEIKRDLTERDEFDAGERRLLNLGHTVGHAIEKLSGFTVRHGEAIAAGTVVAAKAAAKSGLSKTDFSEEIIEALKNNGTPFSLPYGPRAVAEAALSDKKRSGNFIDFVFPTEIGKGEIKRIPVAELEKIVRLGAP